MALFDLIARLRLDASNFQAGLAQSSKGVERFGASITRKLSNYFGGAFLVNQAKQFGQELLNDARKIQQLSDQFGISTDEVQRLRQAAADAGMEFEKFVESGERLAERLRDIEGVQLDIISSEDIAQLNEFNTMLGAAKLKSQSIFAGFVSRRVTGLQELLKGNVAGFLKSASLSTFLSQADLEAFTKKEEQPASGLPRIDALERLRKRDAERKRGVRPERESITREPRENPYRPLSVSSGDPLRAIGAFGGANPDRAVELSNQQLYELRLIRDNTNTIAKKEGIIF